MPFPLLPTKDCANWGPNGYASPFFDVLQIEPILKNLLKKSNLPLLFLLFSLSWTHAQVVDQAIGSIQMGYLGIWWNYESRLAKNWALRSEIGYEAPLLATIASDTRGLELRPDQYPLFSPVLALEPRWYYNSAKRQGNSKNTFHNSGNYASLAARYYPEILGYSPIGTNEVDGGFFIVASWGMRRNINYRWNIELGLGAGIDLTEIRRTEGTEDFEDFLLNMHLRIGYKFGHRAFQ